METIYDWLAVGIFACLIVLFLQRSTASEAPRDNAWHYVPPVVGCAVANFFGNDGQDLLAIGTLIAVLVYTWVVLKPLSHWRS